MTDPFPIYSILAGVLFFAGLAGVFLLRHFGRKIIALNITGGAVFLLLVTYAQRSEDGVIDPVPHAMVITGLVVAVSASALALALTHRVYQETGQIEFPEDHE